MKKRHEEIDEEFKNDFQFKISQKRTIFFFSKNSEQQQFISKYETFANKSYNKVKSFFLAESSSEICRITLYNKCDHSLNV